MTRQENILTLNEHLTHWKRLLSEKICDQSEGEKIIDALQNAIKALEQEPCGDCINRQDVLDMMQMRISSKELYKAVYNLPPVTPQPKMGRWIEENPPMVERYPFCSECGFVNPFENALNYCPNCGTKMSEIPTGSEGSE